MGSDEVMKKKPYKNQTVMKYLSLLFQLSMTMVGSILICFAIGLYIERKLSSNGISIMVGTLVGVCVGFFAVFKVLAKVLK